MTTEIDAKRVAAELVKASVEGRLKRKRTLDYEKERLGRDLDAKWAEAKKSFTKAGLMHGTSTHSFDYAPDFHELEVTREQVERALPEELKEIAKVDGFNLVVRAHKPKFVVALEYLHAVERVVQARISNGDWE